MMEAVGRRKAHWLFGAGSEKTFSGKRRPQEDMVTSAVFGSIRLMSSEDRRKALEVLLGREAFEAAAFAPDRDVDVVLWPRLAGFEGRRHVEPDVLLKAAGKTVIVEVKWHAPLSERQLEQQIEAVGVDYVSAVVMLGEAGVDERTLDTPCFRRTWREVSGELQQKQDDTNTPLGRWVMMMRMFLQETDMGRIFYGLPEPRDAGNVIYRFRKPGHPPWLKFTPAAVGSIHYIFEVNT
jgi:hypothetical protein